MTVKLLMSWDILPGKEQSYFEFAMKTFAPELMKDSRTAPRIYQQVDWSSGGDGIVVRNNIKKINDLKGKVLATCQFTEADFLARYLKPPRPIAKLAELDRAGYVVPGGR